jgi:protein TonB
MASNKADRLLLALIGLSLAVHVAVLMHITGLYHSKALTYVELTLRDVSKPPTRSIPRPRPRPKPPPRQALNEPKITKRAMPQLKPIRIEPVDKDLPDSLIEALSLPDAPSTPGLDIANWRAGDLAEASADYESSNSYLEMVKLRIERHKSYPETARNKHMEGEVTITFIITPEGKVGSVEVVKSSGHRVLDLAALRAVQDAAPFPKPPGRIFRGLLHVKISVVFELT